MMEFEFVTLSGVSILGTLDLWHLLRPGGSLSFTKRKNKCPVTEPLPPLAPAQCFFWVVGVGSRPGPGHSARWAVRIQVCVATKA